MDNRFLFRGKRLDNGEWVYGGLLKHYARQLSPMGDSYKDGDIVYLILRSGFADWNMPRPIDAMPIDPATVGQSTGVFAAKSYRGNSETNRLIFEGDILRVRWKNEEYTGKVYWDECQWFGAEDYLSVAVEHGAEIIGTIHENPELLEGQK